MLSSLSATDHVDPEVISSRAAGDRTGSISPAERQWFVDRGPGPLVGRIHIPTLIVQGTVDTLFTLREGVTNYQVLKQHGVPTSMVWFCGGHGVCLTPAGDQALPLRATLDWLNRYVKRRPISGHRAGVPVRRPTTVHQLLDTELPAGPRAAGHRHRARHPRPHGRQPVRSRLRGRQHPAPGRAGGADHAGAGPRRPSTSRSPSVADPPWWWARPG